MKSKTLFQVFGALLLLQNFGFSQDLEKLTRLELKYWRAFHGDIEIEIFVPFEAEASELTLNATVTPGRNGAQGEKHIVKTIKEQELRAVLQYFNSRNAREFFAKAEQVLQPDGSTLSITATQHSLSLTFSSQYAFSQSPIVAAKEGHAAEFGRIALEILKLSGITVPKDELY